MVDNVPDRVSVTAYTLYSQPPPPTYLVSVSSILNFSPRHDMGPTSDILLISDVLTILVEFIIPQK
jgi:hypothetical protein